MAIVETLLSATIQAFAGLLVQVGFSDAGRELKIRFGKGEETIRRSAFDRAFAHAKETMGAEDLEALLNHRPFQESVIKSLLDPAGGFDVQAAASMWQDLMPSQTRALRRFFSALETTLTADDVWGPILERFEQQRMSRDIRQALSQSHLDVSPEDIVRQVSARISDRSTAEERDAEELGQIVFQHIILQGETSNGSENARQRYLARLLNHCRALPLDALGGDAESEKKVTLDQVYIDLNTTVQVSQRTLEKIQHDTPVDWKQIQQELGVESSERGMPDRQRYLHREEVDEKQLPLPVLDTLRFTPYLALLGDPGGGKSSFIRMVIARLIEGTPLPGLSGDLLPVLVVLRDFVPRLSAINLNALPGAKHADALADAVRDQMLADLAALDAAGFAEGLQDALVAKHCVLVFDGLDEVPQELRGLVRRAVLAAIDRYHPLHVLITCRTRSYVEDAVLPRFEAFTLAPFDERQIETFVRAWYDAQHEVGRFDAVQTKNKTADLTQAALAPELRELSANPMLLTTMALIHQQEVGLPKERVRLYSKAVYILLYRWQREKVSQEGLAEFLRDDRRIREVMERLAYEAHKTKADNDPDASADVPRHLAQDLLEDVLGNIEQARAFLDYVDQRAGLLVGRGGRPDRPDRPAEYSFPHRTFQEYLAGCYLLTGSDSERVERFFQHAGEGDRWNLVAQLGAEELLYNTRNGERQLRFLAYNLLADSQSGKRAERASLWSGQMADLIGRQQIERDVSSPAAGTHYFQRLLPELVALLGGVLSAPERAQAGDVLARLGDPRFRTDAWCLPNDALLGFVEIPAGPFLMGSREEQDPEAFDDEGPQHTVTLPRYYIARYPVTVAQWQVFGEDARYTVDPRSLRGLPNHPVVWISWHDALQYCEWLTVQLRSWEGTPEPLATLLREHRWQVTLPSEAEWEKAARGQDGRRYPWGEEFDPNRANIGGILRTTSAVGCFPGGASPYGVHDLSGNVWEWTRSLLEKADGEGRFSYPYLLTDGRENLSASRDIFRVLRGGAVFALQKNARCAARFNDNPRSRRHDYGFRVVVLPPSDL